MGSAREAATRLESRTRKRDRNRRTGATEGWQCGRRSAGDSKRAGSPGGKYCLMYCQWIEPLPKKSSWHAALDT